MTSDAYSISRTHETFVSVLDRLRQAPSASFNGFSFSFALFFSFSLFSFSPLPVFWSSIGSFLTFRGNQCDFRKCFQDVKLYTKYFSCLEILYIFIFEHLESYPGISRFLLWCVYRYLYVFPT